MMVSVITPTYNSEHFIMQTYESLLSQSFKNWEWLVTDDCSTDKTYHFLENLSRNDSRIQIFKNIENSGAAVTRNTSLKMAKGDFVAFLDSDDLWKPEKLLKQIQFMGKDINFSFTSYDIIDESGKPTGQIVDANQKGKFSYDDMLKKKATLGCSTVMLRRNAFKDLQMPLLRTGQDYGLWLKLLKTNNEAYVVGSTLTSYRITTNSISRNKFKKAKRQWQIYRSVEKLSLIKSSICFCNYAWRAVFRK
ncbi:MAG: glycosyltransferase [Lentisphaeraceae bacterium]|nr:glycosyltransferase [Lentisphaeraceae bacterium]